MRMSALLIFGGFGENPLVLDTVVHQIQQRVHQNFRDERETADENMQVIQQRHAKVGKRNGDDAKQGIFERRFARVLLELEDEIPVQDEIQRRGHQTRQIAGNLNRRVAPQPQQGQQREAQQVRHAVVHQKADHRRAGIEQEVSENHLVNAVAVANRVEVRYVSVTGFRC